MNPVLSDSYYTASTAAPPRCAPLQGTLSSDVCIVGAGIAGCSAALELSRRGYRVAVLEAEHIGWGASGRNGGQVLYGTAAEQSTLEQQLGAADAALVWQTSVNALAQVRQRIRQYAIACDWVDGHMLTAVKTRHWSELQRWHEQLQRRYQYHSTELLDRTQLQAVLATERYQGALYDRNCGHLQPLAYTRGLAVAAQHHGAQLYENSRVLSFVRGPHGVSVTTAHGRVECQQLLLAGNAWLGELVPALQRKLMSVGSYVIATEPLGSQLASELIGNDAAVCDTNWILDYYRRSRDHRLLFGGRVNYSGVDVRAIAPATRARMLAVYPQLANVRIEYAWSCLLDITLNRAPHFGRLSPEVYFLQGFSGHGVALAGMAGELIAEAMAGTTERFDVFARIRHNDFPGGMLLRRPTLAMAMLWYRLRDLL